MSTRTGMLTAVTAVLFPAMTVVPALANGEYDRDYRDYRDRDYRDTRYREVRWHRGPYATFLLGAATGGEVDFDEPFEPDLETGWLVGGTLGYDNVYSNLGGDLRIEAEISYRGQDLTNFPGDVSLTAILGNLWYDFDFWGRLVPYAGAGFGIGFYTDDLIEDSGFAWQVGGGMNIHVSPRYVIGLNYRYLLGYFDAEGGGSGAKANYGAHQLSVSLGYKF